MIDIAIVGGGAAGFFAAINIKAKNPSLSVVIFEKSKTLLGKVKISGGGRCNVTHACFNPTELVAYYPRGKKELLTVFQKFGPTETIEWFKQRRIELKKEADGRMFPVSDDSTTIVNCFLNECERLRIKVEVGASVQQIKQTTNGFDLVLNNQNVKCRWLIIAGGSSDNLWQQMAELGHTIIPPVPSLFTFNIKHPLLHDLMGNSFSNSTVKLLIDKDLQKQFQLKKEDIQQSGPMLITHWGLSGPAVLKLSSVAARLLHYLDYEFDIAINFAGNYTTDQVLETLIKQKAETPKKQIGNTALFGLTNRFWIRLVEEFVDKEQIWIECNNKLLLKIAESITNSSMQVKGKSTFKDEFVTAGGIDLKEVEFKTMESKLIPNLFFAGEVLNIDALTGGFNFQAAWSEAWVMAENI